jgi:hypothetical protein
MTMAALAGLNAFSKRREQRSSQMRHPVHFEASVIIGGPVRCGETVSGGHIASRNATTSKLTCQIIEVTSAGRVKREEAHKSITGIA